MTFQEHKSLVRTGNCVAWPSACSASTATPTSPPPTLTTPATCAARSSYFRPH